MNTLKMQIDIMKAADRSFRTGKKNEWQLAAEIKNNHRTMIYKGMAIYFISASDYYLFDENIFEERLHLPTLYKEYEDLHPLTDKGYRKKAEDSKHVLIMLEADKFVTFINQELIKYKESYEDLLFSSEGKNRPVYVFDNYKELQCILMPVRVQED